MSIYIIIQDTKYFTLNEARKEIQNILNNNTQSIDTFILMESINKSLSNKKNNLKILCYYQFLLDSIKDNDKNEIKKYCKKLSFKY